jgi:hypothetical protein
MCKAMNAIPSPAKITKKNKCPQTSLPLLPSFGEETSQSLGFAALLQSLGQSPRLPLPNLPPSCLLFPPERFLRRQLGGLFKNIYSNVTAMTCKHFLETRKPILFCFIDISAVNSLKMKNQEADKLILLQK